jgi:exodeoxyribonuclease V alpha subunit
MILENYENLLIVPGITMKNAIKIHNSLLEYEESHAVIAYLFELGFNTKDALAIYNKYFNNTKNIIETNPYQLIDDVDNINFIKVDSLKNKLNITSNDIRRIQACILYVMNELCNMMGHTYLSREEISNHVIRYLNDNSITYDDINNNLNYLYSNKKVIIEHDRYYLYNMYHAELNITNFFTKLSKKNNNIKIADDFLEKLESYFDLKYNDKQKEAIKKSIKNDFLIITGGPGTGKTTIIKGIVELYREINGLNYEELMNEIVLLAPTGRASKRISESALLPAITIHRFLKWNKETNSFGVNEYNKSNVKCIIIDEVSMIDTLLLDSLIKGITSNVKIILVGDYNQLPSVGPGQILKDLIESDVFDTIFLKTLYRQKENSGIISLAHDINSGETDFNYLNKSDDYIFLECSPVDIKNNLKKICEQELKMGNNYKNIQVLAPLYKGENGIDNLNKLLQGIFNPKSPSKKELVVGDIIYREQDKVLQLVNMIDENVFNGDIGIIERIVSDPKKEIYINFDGNIIKYTMANFINIKHGYCVSVHKAQGSEFDIIIMPMASAFNRMLYRKLIYTGITRAKKKLFVIGEYNAFIRGILNNESQIRKTSLKEFLQKITFDK